MAKVEVQHSHIINPPDMTKVVRAITFGAIAVTLVYLGGDTVRQVILNVARSR